MRTCIILGTRHETSKMSPAARAREGLGAEWFMVHTGQDCSCYVDTGVLGGLGLPGVGCNLDVGSGGYGVQTGAMLSGIEEVLVKEEPDVVLVEDDTNTVLAGALAVSDVQG